MEKLALALVSAARKLRHYFQVHIIRVLIEHRLRAILQKADLSGRMVKWAIELGEHDIRIVPRNATKGQVVADFIAEFTHNDELKQSRKEENGLDIREEWQFYLDGVSNSQGLGAGMVFITSE